MKGASVAGRSVFLLSLAIGGIAAADRVDLPPMKDNTLFEDDFGLTSNGSGQYFFAGRTSQGLIRRGLIAFDVSDNIPAGSTINSVSLTVHVSRARGPEVEVDLNRMLADWGESASTAVGEEGTGAPADPSDATWLHTFYDSVFWRQQGGDFSPNVSASAAVSGSGFYTFVSTFDVQLIQDVQDWIDDPTTNFGWMVKVSDEYFPMSAKRFDTRENLDPGVQPSLTVIFTPPGAEPPS